MKHKKDTSFLRFLPKGIFSMKHKKDTSFLLTSFLMKEVQTTPEYKSLKRDIDYNGWYPIGTETNIVKVYTPELALIFTSKDLPAFNRVTKKKTKINGWDYIETYIEGYTEGEKYFDDNFAVSPNTIYAPNSEEQYVRDLHLNYFHISHPTTHTPTIIGWQAMKKQYPIIITHGVMKEYGHYSGLVAKVDALVRKYPKKFQTFDKCEHELAETSPQPTKPKIPARYYALYHWILIEIGTENNFDRNDNDQYIKSKIEAFAQVQYPQTSSQNFYRQFNELDITDKTAIANSFGHGYKEKIIEISNNNAKVITHLKNYPN